MGWEAILDILNKLIPGRKEAYVNELNDLLVQYNKALEEGRDTDASILRKRMVVLRKKLGYSEGEL
jgi:hypothetical protein